MEPVSQTQYLRGGSSPSLQLRPAVPLCAVCQRYPQETGGWGCAAQQLCPPPRRPHPSTAGTFTLLLTWGWPSLAGTEPRQRCRGAAEPGGRVERGRRRTRCGRERAQDQAGPPTLRSGRGCSVFEVRCIRAASIPPRANL